MDTHDPVRRLTAMGGWCGERSTYFFGNFQVVTATKPWRWAGVAVPGDTVDAILTDPT